MKPPSKSISASLSGQRAPGRTAGPVTVTSPRANSPSMTLPGNGGSSKPPGMRHPSSAAKYAEPNSSKLGG